MVKHRAARRNRAPTRDEILQLAVEARLDPRSARKALEKGANSLRGDAGVRAAKAIAALGLLILSACVGDPFVLEPIASIEAATPIVVVAPEASAQIQPPPQALADSGTIVSEATAPEAAPPQVDAGHVPAESAPPQGGSLCPLLPGTPGGTACDNGEGGSQYQIAPTPNARRVACASSVPPCPSGWICFATVNSNQEIAVCP